MKKKLTAVVVVVALVMVTAGCATGYGIRLHRPETRGMEWRGGVVGAAATAVVVGTLAELSARETAYAAETGRPVRYSTGGWVYEVRPVPYGFGFGRCGRVRELVRRRGRIVRDRIVTVCGRRR